MDFRRLRYIVAIAEAGSFTHAAFQLHMEQPPLSQQIRAFEKELGLVLFIRSRQGAVPTEAGRILIEQARTILAMEAEFLSLARGLARGEQGRLRVGMAGAVSLLPIIPNAIRAFREKWPEIVITLEESNTPALCEALHDRRVDIAIIRPPAPDPNIVVVPLMQERTVIALPKGHDKWRRRCLHLNDISDEPFILFERELGPGFYDAIIAACQQAGFTPRLGQSAPQIAATVPMVAAGMGVSIVPAYLDQIHAEGATFHPIVGPAPRSTIALAFHNRPSSGPVANFERILRSLCDKAS
ncbi:LysR family transcriptional regulator [Neoasaia chiangmaiensis]|uniref:LysR family transcriptional regulator n=1 Tax=Neoasaia chiangmaiensis TaxID=320497 RepID=A0A1U9KTP1_9PROT|nr:LysR family transcriptional regulator [Neoasaia chiangmaiensis]AQS89191.1 LysR family transcriptional regulator [Neoasaia chiangmaiensis]